MSYDPENYTPRPATAQVGAQAAGGASGEESPPRGPVYWIDIDHDLRVTIDGCPVIVRRPGGTIVQIDTQATPAQRAELLTRHVEAIRIDQ